MYYQKQQILTAKQCNYIIKRLGKAKWYTGWTRADVQEWRTDSITWFDEPLSWWFMHFRRFLVSTPEYPVNWLQQPYQISRFAGGNLHEWHRHDRGNRGKNRSSNSASLICELQTAPGAVTETDHGVFDLAVGEGFVMPATDRLQHTAPLSGERLVLTVCGMRYNPQPR